MMLAAPLSGCFTYRPAALLAVRPGADVRVVFATANAAGLEQLLGPRVRSAGGQVQEVLGDSALVILLEDITTEDGEVLPWRRGRVTLPTRLMTGVQQRTLDRRRTRAFAAATAVAFATTVVAAIRRAGFRGAATSTQGGGPPE